MIEILEQLGFHRQIASSVYVKRISIITYIEYDTADGFITLYRQSEHLKRPDRIILPKPIRDAESLQNFMSFLIV